MGIKFQKSRALSLEFTDSATGFSGFVTLAPDEGYNPMIRIGCQEHSLSEWRYDGRELVTENVAGPHSVACRALSASLDDACPECQERFHMQKAPDETWETYDPEAAKVRHYARIYERLLEFIINLEKVLSKINRTMSVEDFDIDEFLAAPQPVAGTAYERGAEEFDDGLVIVDAE